MTNVWDSSTASGGSFSGTNNSIFTKSSASGWYDGYVRTTDLFTINIKLKGSASEYLGIAKDPLQDGNKTWHDLEYGFSGSGVVIAGAGVTPQTSFTRTDSSECELIKSGNNLTWKVDGTQVHTINNMATGTYYGLGAIYGQNESVTFIHINEVDDQQIKIEFYPTNNINAVTQELKVEFYPTNNLQNSGASNVNQQLKIEFYANGNEQTTGTGGTDAWKWWLGMRGKKRYGNKGIKRISI